MGMRAPRNHESAMRHARPRPAFQGCPGEPDITELEFDRRVVEYCLDWRCSECKAIREHYAGRVKLVKVLRGELSVAP